MYYGGKKIIIYLTENNKAYFDLNHVINLLDDFKAKDKKYLEYKNCVELYDFKDNEHGGFYVKEYINREILFKILLHSNSSFAQKFKDEISKVLDKLCERGDLIINEKEEIVLKEKLDDRLEYYDNEQCLYNNNNIINFIKDRINNLKNDNWNKYMNRHVMYCFIITIDYPEEKSRILCKIGYSMYLLERIKSLKNEYKCKFYLIGLKLIYGEKDEKNFHSMLKIKYPELKVSIKIGSHTKEEVYIFDTRLFNDFITYEEKVKFTTKEIKLEKESKKIIEEYFENIEKRLQLEVIQNYSKLIKIEKVSTELQSKTIIEMNKEHYNYLILSDKNEVEKLKEKNKRNIEKDKYAHVENMKNKEIELKKLELEILKIKNVGY